MFVFPDPEPPIIIILFGPSGRYGLFYCVFVLLVFNTVEINHFVRYKNDKPSKTKSYFEQLLPKIYARRPCENNKRVCIDCLKSRSKKNKFECKNCGCTKFYVLNHQSPSFYILPSS